MNKIIAILILTCFTLTSCCREQMVAITSEPPMANVTVNGYDCGTTPTVLQMKRHTPYEVVLSKEGYQPTMHNVCPGTNEKVINRVFLPFGVGLTSAGIGLLFVSGGAAAIAAPVLIGAGCFNLVGYASNEAGTIVDLETGYCTELSDGAMHANLQLAQ